MSTLNKVFAPRFMGWVAFTMIASYFLFAVKTQEGQSAFAPLFRGDFKGFISSIKMPRIKLGIDLQGGTYFVLSVDVEKAIETRLAKEVDALEEAFSEKEFKEKPTDISVAGTKMTLSFKTEEDARACFHFIKKTFKQLSPLLKESKVFISLSAADEQRIRSGVVDQAVNVLQNRLNGFGVSGLVVQPHGNRQIVVQLPGVDDPVRVKELITKSALLEFKIVEREASTKEQLLDAYDGETPRGKAVITGAEGGRSSHSFLVTKMPAMTGDHISDARVGYDQFGRIQVNFSLDTVGAQKFKKLTSRNVGRRMAIVIDNVVYSAPEIKGEIGGGEVVIQGSFSPEEARDLALVLRSGSLLAPLKFEQENRVGASLGQDSIEKGILSCLVGFLLIFLVALYFYGVLGLLAVIALKFNLFLILLFLSYFEATLTLAGIAGMALTVGMAIDASIIIFEKIREDLLAHSGSSFRAIVVNGFKNAMSVIMDSNITTFITGLILFKFGGPTIKGFAVTLIAGIIATIVAGVFFLQSLILYVVDLRDGRGFKIR